jgi:protein-S-isoprenylcysteine O-methyltransferase Ste14
MKIDPAIYYAHCVFWGAFFAARLFTRVAARNQSSVAPVASPAVAEEKTAPGSRLLVTFHILAFVVMYFGIDAVVFHHRSVWFRGSQFAGVALIAAGALLVAWTLFSFHSWRLRARIDAGHQLATGGPFKIIRHPIYMSLNLLAFGSAIWVPHIAVWLGLGLMILGGDLRARAEEKVLEAAFGSAYRDYCARTPRFLPGLY